MTSKRSVKTMLKRARRRTTPFRVAIGDETLEGTFTALPFMRWQEIQAEFPPRDGNKVDAGWGYSYVDTWPAMIRASMTDPEMDDDDWATFFDLLGEGDMSRLAIQIINLNERVGDVDIPKSPPDSSGTTPAASD